jgi:hypothetical protein
MNPHPDSMIFLAGIRHHELQAEAARFRLAREAYGDGPTMHATISTACRQLRATIVHVRQKLEIISWTPAVLQRGAFPR